MIPVVFVLLSVPTLMFGILFMFYRFGGWHKLSQNYKHMGPISDGETIKWTSIVIGNSSRYQRSMTIVVSRKGLYIQPAKFLQIAWHKPLLIPWKDMVSMQEKDSLVIASFIEITLKDGTRLTLGDRIQQAIDKMGIEI